jgi:hypothetical protein
VDVKRLVARLASGARVPVFVVPGRGSREKVRDLALDSRLYVADSPRAATVLLLVGKIPDALVSAARAIHDEMPTPRATACWAVDAGQPEQSGFPDAVVLATDDDVGAALARLQTALLFGHHPSEPDLLPDIDPAPWRGVGPYGQGGKGMTGGVPYGRPITGRAPDRDGLELDQLPVRIGPLFQPFPPGLVLDLKLQGDVVQEVSLGENPFAAAEERSAAPAPHSDLFELALSQPVPIRLLELARARHHLGWLANALTVHGLGALGFRARRLAAGLTPDGAVEVRALQRILEGVRSLGWTTAGVGLTDAESLVGVSPGPVSRAASIARDARAADPAYLSLGFEPVVQHGADARARWRQRLAETLQALEFAERAGARSSTPTGSVEAPRGTLTRSVSPAAGLLALVPLLLPGMEWGEAVTTVVSLDLDVEEAAASRPPAAA